MNFLRPAGSKRDFVYGGAQTVKTYCYFFSLS